MRRLLPERRTDGLVRPLPPIYFELALQRFLPLSIFLPHLGILASSLEFSVRPETLLRNVTNYCGNRCRYLIHELRCRNGWRDVMPKEHVDCRLIKLPVRYHQWLRHNHQKWLVRHFSWSFAAG